MVIIDISSNTTALYHCFFCVHVNRESLLLCTQEIIEKPYIVVYICKYLIGDIEATQINKQRANIGKLMRFPIKLWIMMLRLLVDPIYSAECDVD